MKRLVLLSIAATFYILVHGQNSDSLKTTVYLISRQKVSTSELEQAQQWLRKKCNTPNTHWLYHYYLAYTNMQLCFRNKNLDAKQELQDEAKLNLDKIIMGDISEVETLKGYCYMAYIATDPAINGPKYAQNVIDCYKKAIKNNPNNPRAIILNAVFQKNMQSFLGNTYKAYKSDISRAKKLLLNTDSTGLQPYWGKAYIFWD